MGPTSVILGKFRIMTTKQSVRGGWSGVATSVRRSQVPLVLHMKVEEKTKSFYILGYLLKLIMKIFMAIWNCFPLKFGQMFS